MSTRSGRLYGRTLRIRRGVLGMAFDTTNVLLLILFSLTIIYPFYEMVVNSISSEIEIVSHFRAGFRTPPRKLFLDNWQIVLSSRMVLNSFMNSLYVTLGGSLYSLFLSVTFAYPLSRRDLRHRNLFTFLLVFTMFFGGGLIPYYLLMRSLGLLNTRIVLMVGAINAWNTLIVRNYFMTIPQSLQDSAKVDGANEIVILQRIMMPLSKPVIATVLLWLLVSNWNAWVPSMIFTSDPDKFVLQIILRGILTASRFNITASNPDAVSVGTALDKMRRLENEGLKAAVLIFTVAPILLAYPFLQKYFVKGILIGSLRG